MEQEELSIISLKIYFDKHWSYWMALTLSAMFSGCFSPASPPSQTALSWYLVFTLMLVCVRVYALFNVSEWQVAGLTSFLHIALYTLLSDTVLAPSVTSALCTLLCDLVTQQQKLQGKVDLLSSSKLHLKRYFHHRTVVFCQPRMIKCLSRAKPMLIFPQTVPVHSALNSLLICPPRRLQQLLTQSQLSNVNLLL